MLSRDELVEADRKIGSVWNREYVIDFLSAVNLDESSIKLCAELDLDGDLLSALDSDDLKLIGINDRNIGNCVLEKFQKILRSACSPREAVRSLKTESVN